jgi:sodium/bile acid cotransporter 7
MKFFLKIDRRSVLGLFTAALAFTFVTLMGQLSLSSDELTNGDKRKKINQMYVEYKRQFPEVSDISTQKAMKLADMKQVIFIDVRESEEQQISMLPGAITQKEYLDHPEKYNDVVKIVYCTISYRSGLLAQKLQKDGVVMYNLRGGLLAWVHDGGKVFDRNGESKRIHVYGRKWNLGPKNYEAIW